MICVIFSCLEGVGIVLDDLSSHGTMVWSRARVATNALGEKDRLFCMRDLHYLYFRHRP